MHEVSWKMPDPWELKNPFVEPEAEAPPLQRPHRIYTVSELTRLIQGLLEESLAFIWVEGEVSQPTVSTKGHLYFSLKDSQALIRCVLWREAREGIKFTLEHGMKVICCGKVSVYPPRGDYQLYVEQLEPKGIGALQLAFEQLKGKLQREGLFDEARKRPLPVFPERIGIVTSPTGAAIEDMLKILRVGGEILGRLQVIVRPVRVQGEGAAEAIAMGIQALNRFNGLDLLIVGRGGGSLEDLWAFNEEVVARAIAGSRLPVISAVGHERDYTISDFVADVRAPTPTKAAELVLAKRQQVLDRLLAILEDPAFAEPEVWLTELTERLTERQQELLEAMEEPLFVVAHRIGMLRGKLMSFSPQAIILHQAGRLHQLHRILESDTVHEIQQLTSRVHGLAGRLNALSPLAVLGRGYSITFNSQGRIIKEAAAVKSGEQIRTRLHRGELISRVEERSDHGNEDQRFV